MPSKVLVWPKVARRFWPINVRFLIWKRTSASDHCLFSSEFSDEVLRAEHADLGLDSDAATSRSRWLGEPMDYDLVIGAMWRQRDRALAAAPA